MNSLQIAERNGAHWGSNDPNAWISDFAPKATVMHPFFREAVTPTIAIEVMNATVCGTTEFDGCRLVKGDGEGIDDLVEMHFIETGTCAGYLPQYVGRMVVFARITFGLIAGLKVKGYDLIHSHPHRLRPFSRTIQRNTTRELPVLIAESWSQNNMASFCSLFAVGANIIHPLFSAPITPEIAADVLNSAMNGQSVARAPRLLMGDGSGEFDYAEMAFEETGDQVGYLPETMGVMHSSFRIANGQIQEMLVHGYQAERSRFRPAALTNETAEPISIDMLASCAPHVVYRDPA